MADAPMDTREYFRRRAHEWRHKAVASVGGNVIRQRNAYVLQIAQARPRLERSLDVGCGTGELVCDLARRGVDAVGLDFADEMIDLARRKAVAENLPKAAFVHCSVFDYTAQAAFDLISANGFIEYLSLADVERFFDHARGQLRPNGSLVVGSRNRLFNAVTFNEFTRMEIEAGTLMALIEEIMLITAQPTKADMLAALEQAAPSPIAQREQYPRTGVEIANRHQYTPCQLVHLFRKHGYRIADLCPVHYHVSVPRFAHDHEDVHRMIAEIMQPHTVERHYLLPFGSTFMVHAVPA